MTPEFKKWFGNSRVVDEQNNPLIVYHGSPNIFTKFSYDFIGTQGTNEGQGFYFTNNKSIAAGYVDRNGKKGKLFVCYLHIEKPLNYTQKKITKNQLAKFIKAIDPDGSGYLANWGEVEWEGYSKILSEAVTNEWESSDNDVDLICGIINATGKNYKLCFPKLKETLGYDGIIVENPEWGDQTIYIVFSPEQIMEVKE